MICLDKLNLIIAEGAVGQTSIAVDINDPVSNEVNEPVTSLALVLESNFGANRQRTEEEFRVVHRSYS